MWRISAMRWRCYGVVDVSSPSHFGRIILKTWGTVGQKLAAWSTVKRMRWGVYLLLHSERSEDQRLYEILRAVSISDHFQEPFLKHPRQTEWSGGKGNGSRKAWPCLQGKPGEQTSYRHPFGTLGSLHLPHTASVLSSSVAWNWFCIFTNALVSEWEMASD